MRQLRGGVLGVAAAVAVVFGWVSSADAKEVAGKQLPEQVKVADRTLTLNGAAVQRKFVFNIYAVALYLEQPTRIAQQAVQSDQVKRIHLRMLRNASKDQVADALRNGVKSNNGDISGVEDRLGQLLAALPDVKTGDEITITYVPNEGTHLVSQRKGTLTIPGKDFADAFFRIWLGPSDGIARIRRNLMAGPGA